MYTSKQRKKRLYTILPLVESAEFNNSEVPLVLQSTQKHMKSLKLFRNEYKINDKYNHHHIKYDNIRLIIIPQCTDAQSCVHTTSQVKQVPR